MLVLAKSAKNAVGSIVLSIGTEARKQNSFTIKLKTATAAFYMSI